MPQSHKKEDRKNTWLYHVSGKKESLKLTKLTRVNNINHETMNFICSILNTPDTSPPNLWWQNEVFASHAGRTRRRLTNLDTKRDAGPIRADQAAWMLISPDSGEFFQRQPLALPDKANMLARTNRRVRLISLPETQRRSSRTISCASDNRYVPSSTPSAQTRHARSCYRVKISA